MVSDEPTAAQFSISQSIFSAQVLEAVPLENLEVGDTVGLFLSREGDLHFSMNGFDLGAACHGLPTDIPLFVAVDVCNSTAQVSLVN